MESPSLDASSSKNLELPLEQRAVTVADNAKAATDKEQNMTLMQGLRLYPKAIGWSIVISTCIAMEGYDLCLLGNFCEHAIPSSFYISWHVTNRDVCLANVCKCLRRIPTIQ